MVHDKTFKAPGNGTIRIVDANGTVLHQHQVETGDIWRACQVKRCPDSRLGQVGCYARPCDRCAGRILVGQDPRP